METLPLIKLKKGKEASILRGHPWVFSGAIAEEPDSLVDGDLVVLQTASGKHLGSGHYNAGSIRVRILTRADVPIDQHFWDKAIANAYQYRRNIGLTQNPDTNAFRLVHGEGDQLPGLIIDIYDDVVVIQPHSAGMQRAVQEIGVALNALDELNLNTIYVKGISGASDYLKGKKEETVVRENGHQFQVNWVTGQKTGFFLDQRDNRQLLAHYAKGKTVLNTFCYSGGFSVYALDAGASLVHSVDSSAKAIDLVNENVALLDDKTPHEAFVADTQHYLKDCDSYDIVVLDPPAFAKHLSAKHRAVQGYKRLNIAGLNKVKPGGLLFTFSCSQVVDAQLFYNTIVAAAMEVKRNIRVMHRLSQPADHPVNIFHPEGSYLKGLVLYVE